MKYTFYKLLEEYKIVIPMIQRDYAQGRETAVDLRKNFLSKIRLALENENHSLNLDFVYGYTEKDSLSSSVFIPLDGQQRLTTLWLIHWYFSLKEKPFLGDEFEFNPDLLLEFSYATRISSKRFCEKLILEGTREVFNCLPISEHITDASWFMPSWLNDPTIASMINMIDSIHEMLGDCQGVLPKLVRDNRITFDYIDIKSDEFKLTDELYIKMNSRGKPLTPFENFKAQFSDMLSSKTNHYNNATLIYEDVSISFQQYFAFKIDGIWMDLFWKYRKQTKVEIDQCILNFIKFISEFIFYKSNIAETQIIFQPDNDLLIRNIFSSKENVLLLFDSLDFLAALEDQATFFNEIFSGVSLFESYSNNLFFRVITANNFDVKHKVLLYAILTYCIKTKTKKPTESLSRFIRIVRNLLLSVRQINTSKRIEYSSNLRLLNIADYAKFIDTIVNLISENSENSVYEILSNNIIYGFPIDSIILEKNKAAIVTAKPELLEAMIRLEEHNIIQGNTANFKFDTDTFPNNVDIFYEIWSDAIPSSLVIRALLTVGDFAVVTHDYSPLGQIVYFGTDNNWNRILTTTDKNEGKKISKCLSLFFESYRTAIGTNVIDKLNYLINNYNSETQDWRYYFIKYKYITEKIYERQNVISWDGDGFEVNSLGNSGRQPLHSYHLNPYLIEVKRHFLTNGEVVPYYGRFTDPSYLLIRGYIQIFCVADGWRINPYEGFRVESLFKKTSVTSQNGHFKLSANKERDRIEVAIDFINAILR